MDSPDAQSDGVRPNWSATPRGAPAATRKRQTAVWPDWAAMCRGVLFTCAGKAWRGGGGRSERRRPDTSGRELSGRRCAGAPARGPARLVDRLHARAAVDEGAADGLVALGGGDMQRGVEHIVPGVNLRAARQEEAADGLVVGEHRGDVEGGLVVLRGGPRRGVRRAWREQRRRPTAGRCLSRPRLWGGIGDERPWDAAEETRACRDHPRAPAGREAHRVADIHARPGGDEGAADGLLAVERRVVEGGDLELRGAQNETCQRRRGSPAALERTRRPELVSPSLTPPRTATQKPPLTTLSACAYGRSGNCTVHLL